MKTRIWCLSAIVITLLSGCFCRETPKMETQQVPVREDVEWLDVWLPNTNNKDLPRVLLIGNSITRAYYPQVEVLLEGTAYIGRLTTSKSLGDPAFLVEVALVLSYDRFDVVHFNNGLHGWGYTEDEYRESFPALLETIKTHAPKARLIWASTSPVRTGVGMIELADQTERVRVRNQIALEAIEGKDIRVNDLFGLVVDHPEFYAGGDGVHLVPAGVEAMAAQVARIVSETVKGK